MSEPDFNWDELQDLFGGSVGKGIDLMHEETEKEIKRTRNRLAKEYKEAEKELKKKADDYLRRFEKADREKAKLVEQGLISKSEYIDWRKNKILYHKNMQNKVNSMAEYLSNVDRQAADIVRKNTFGVYASNYNYAEYQVGKQVKTGLSFTLLNEKSVERLAHKNPKLLPNPSDKVKKKIKSGELKKWNARKINNVITQGILQGTPISEIANALNNVTRMGWNNAVRNARTAMTGAQNAGRLDGYKSLEKQGVVQEKVWIATPDERTRESHIEIDGEQVPIDKPFSNNLMYPADPDGEPAEVYNCRCTMRTEVVGFKNEDGSVTEIGHKRDETMHSDQMQAEKNRRGIKEAERPIKHTKEFEQLKERAESNNIAHNKVIEMDKALGTETAIKKLAGGDMTKGSCASLAFSYIGNRKKLDVTDFRGGKSQSMFSNGMNIEKMLKTANADLTIHQVEREAKGAAKILMELEKDAEFYFDAGTHAAIVRNSTAQGLQYLELQSATNSGWRPFKTPNRTVEQTLQKRFGCRKTIHQIKMSDGTKFVFEKKVRVAPLSSIEATPEFREMLGYINTATNAQKKGALGGTK